MPNRIGFIPGAGYDKEAYFPLCREELVPDHFLLSYRRKKDVESNQAVQKKDRELENQHGIKRYAKRVLKQLLERDEQVDLIAHSMGWAIAQALLVLIEEARHNGLVQNVIGLTPCLVGGPPAKKFYRHPNFLTARVYDWMGYQRPDFVRAVAHIKRQYPNFNPACSGEETFRALRQAVTGSIPFCESFPLSRQHVFYSPNDRMFPAEVVEAMLKRHNISATKFTGYGDHSVPVVDLEGAILQQILRRLEQMSQTRVAAE